MKKTTTLSPRSGRLNRFQTPVVGLGYVPTAIQARFDPYAEPARQPQHSVAEMETVDRLEIPAQ